MDKLTEKREVMETPMALMEPKTKVFGKETNGEAKTSGTNPIGVMMTITVTAIMKIVLEKIIDKYIIELVSFKIFI